MIAKWNVLAPAALAAATLTLQAGPAPAQTVAQFYKSKTIDVYVGYSPGGGYDTYARTVARHMGKHIPGHPDMVVKNRPGAGSMLLTNELYNTLPKDGTAIGVIGRGMPMEPLFGTPAAKFDASKFTWLGSANNEVSVCVSWHGTGVKTMADLRTRGMIVGGTGPGADTDVFPLVMNNVLGTKLKLVTGYPGGNDINFAIERGELEGRCGWSWSSVKSTRASWLRDNKVNVLLQMSTAKHPDMPDVPFIMDFADNAREKKILAFIFARQAWGRPFLAPPGLPADRAQALQVAFAETMKDPAFLADAGKQKLEVAPISGEEIGQLVTDLYATPKDIILAAKEAAEKKGNIEITKVVIPVVTIRAAITKLANGNRELSFEGEGKKETVGVSGSRTKLKIGGKSANRKALKVGMSCAITYQGAEAKDIACD